MQYDNEEAFLDFLEADVFRANSRPASAEQLAIAPLSRMTVALAWSIATRNRNVAPQDFHLGLDFSDTPW